MESGTVTVTSALTQLWEVVTSCVTFISGNAILMVLLVASLVAVGFKIFKKAKKAARS